MLEFIKAELKLLQWEFEKGASEYQKHLKTGLSIFGFQIVIPFEIRIGFRMVGHFW